MGVVFISEVRRRTELARADSDIAYFFDLLILGEALVKAIGVGLVASLPEDKEGHRYRLEHALVRADGIGAWAHAIDDVLLGPASHHLRTEAREEQRQLTQLWARENVWQTAATARLRKACRTVDAGYEALAPKIAARTWFHDFVWLRNRTRGHGAPTAHKARSVCPLLIESIDMIAGNLALFKRPWAYIRQQLSGRYRIIAINGDQSAFEVVNRNPHIAYEDGIYILFDEPCRVRLLTTDEDLSDFFFPNGGFTGKTFEVLSYRSDVRRVLDSTIYMRPPTALPPSETEGLPNLEPIGNVFTNVPPVSPGYVERSELESELRSVLMNERHPVVTLMGRGGIGKTSVALKVLQALAYEERFFAVLWFSARDIDLRAEGPKVVRPQVLTQGDIAKEFCRLMDAGAVEKKGHRPLEHLGESMQDTEHAPLLFVFDNFETVRNPEEVYTWMDTYIRPPNKILITTRHRSFKGDYPLDVPGMSEEEFERLVRQTSSLLGIQRLVTGEYLRNLFVESGGHPYVVKILLGELARAGRPRKIDRIMADQDDILDALFERTFEGLPAVAKRIYLTLCNWRSVIPMLALEATLLRPTHERIDVGGALETLERTSLVERVTSGRDSSEFLMVPLASYLYGKRKIAVSPMKSVIDVDTAVLQRFGAARESDVRHGVGPRIDRFFRSVATGLSDGALQWSDYLPVLVYVSRKYPKAWLLLANLYVEHQSGKALDDAVECVRKYLEHFPHDPEAWHRLARLSQMKQDYLGEATALIHVAGLPGVTYAELSEIAVRINEMLGQRKVILYLAERRALIEPLIDVLSAREREANATDYSRIAWLQLQINQESEAKRFVLRGLRKDSSNVHCRRLAARLSLKV